MNLTPDRIIDLAWSQSWQIAVLAIAVAAIVRLVGRGRPHMAYLLWLLVLVKCVTPPIWSSSAGVFSWAQLRVVLPDKSPDLEPFGEQVGILSERSTVGDVPSAAKERPEFVSSSSGISTAALLAAIWCAGSLLLGGLVFGKWVRCRRKIHAAAPANEALEGLAKDLCRRLGLRRPVRVRTTATLDGPAVFGWWRPTILLPERLLEADTAKRIEPIIAHELIHIRRGDTLWSAVQLLAQLIWWFHPLVWWANRELRRARERCADMETVSGLSCRPTEYARRLLDTAELLGSFREQPLSAGVHLSNVTATRLEEIMNDRAQFPRSTPIRYWIVFVACSVMVLPGAGLTLNASEEESEETDAPAREEAPRSADTGSELEAALKRLGVEIKRHEDGRVSWVNWPYDNPQKPTNEHLMDIALLDWSETPWNPSGSTFHDENSYARFARPRLVLQNAQIDDDELEHLKTLTHLRSLDLYNNSQITDIGLAHLAPLAQLELLWLGGAQITDAGLAHLRPFTKLKELRLDGTRVTDDGLAHLIGLKEELESLGLNGCNEVTDGALEYLTGFTRLEHLLLNGTQVTDEGLEHIATMKSLKWLWLRGTNVTDAGLVHLKGLTNLEFLTLGENGISDAGLKHLAGLEMLSVLAFRGDGNRRITDNGLVHLKGLENLTVLRLQNTSITDAGLKHLEELKQLKRLDLRGTKVTDEGVSRVRELLPACDVQF